MRLLFLAIINANAKNISIHRVIALADYIWRWLGHRQGSESWKINLRRQIRFSDLLGAFEVISHLDFRETNNMRITELGRYELTEDTRIRSGLSVGTCPKGMVFNVTQLNLTNFQFYSPEMGDWQHYDFPARRIPIEGDRVIELHRGKPTETKGTVVEYQNGLVTIRTDSWMHQEDPTPNYHQCYLDEIEWLPVTEDSSDTDGAPEVSDQPER